MLDEYYLAKCMCLCALMSGQDGVSRLALLTFPDGQLEFRSCWMAENIAYLHCGSVKRRAIWTAGQYWRNIIARRRRRRQDALHLPCQILWLEA